MDILFLAIIAFLFLLAIFDLTVGVSNDAVNFLNSSLGTKVAPFKHVILVAAIGVFIGAAMSNGMMDIARHGIFRPEQFSFYDLICIFMAVMVTDIILLDVFNSLGMPTSTTVSMVFELLGATFVVAVVKVSASAGALGFDDLLNTEKALSVIIGIFLSVAIAFVFGTIVQFITRAIFSFNYRKNLKWKIGLFGGICTTAIIYFLLIKGAKDLTFMTPEVKAWIHEHTCTIILCCLAGFTVVMQLLHILRVNVLKVVVLIGTLALAMAFEGNDWVNIIGVPLSGLSSYQDFMAAGGGDASTHMMGALNGPANTPIYFLIGAGVIMVISLATSKKAQNVSKTQIGLSAQTGGDELFGSSRIARHLVRWFLNVSATVRSHIPEKVRKSMDARFNIDDSIIAPGASFDLVRGAVNLVLAGALIALGTSLKLPLSTTFVTFMVAMGTSLSDRAWGRESAVFRITGVISVIGGWFLTAGAAFIGAGVVVSIMYWGGHWAMIILAVITVVMIVRSNLRFKEKSADSVEDTLFQAIVTAPEPKDVWPLLLKYIDMRQSQFLTIAAEKYDEVADSFLHDNPGPLQRADSLLARQKSLLKSDRRRQTLGLRRVPYPLVIEKTVWFHLSNDCCMWLLYNLRRITEVAKEHVENNFPVLPQAYHAGYLKIRNEVSQLLHDTAALTQSTEGEPVGVDTDRVNELRRRADGIKDLISDSYHTLHNSLQEVPQADLSVLYVYINILQETQELVSTARKYLRAFAKLRNTDFTSRPRRRE